MTLRKRLAVAATVLAIGATALGDLAPVSADPQRATPRARGQRQKPAATPAAGQGSVLAPRASAGATPQAELDDALFRVEQFFDVQARVPRAYAEARERIGAVIVRFPSDPRPRLKAAWLDERLGRFDDAAAGMEQYATLAGRSPNALRRLAAFYRGRGRAADEVRVLDELAAKLPEHERAPVYKRAIAAINDARPPGVSANTFYMRLVEADPRDTSTLRAYVDLLLESRDPSRALAAVAHAEAAPGYKPLGVRRELLAARARIHDASGERARALAVYEEQFTPRWPRAIAADYYTLLSRYGLYRMRRRDFQTKVSAGNAPLGVVARLFNFYAYEGNLPAAARLLEGYEAARGTSQWTDGDLELAGGLYAQIGDYDNATRYYHTLYLQGALQHGAPRREDVLAGLFGALIDAGDRPTRIAPGGITLYRDVARLDPRPGALNGLLSLILAGNNPVLEYEAEAARAAGYANRALAHSIYTAFLKEFPQSPRLGEMALRMMRGFEELGMDREAAAVGRELMSRQPASDDFEDVALAVADAHVRLKDRAAERAVLATLLERAAARQRGALLRRDERRWLFRAPEPVFEDEIHGGPIDAGDRLFVAPSGALLPRYRADAFLEPESSEGYAIYEPTEDASSDDEYREDAPEDYLGTVEREAERPAYADLLERMVASFEADERKTEALAFFWAEVNRRPKDEGLHERFLRWLGSADLVNDQLRAYRIALERYDDGTWLHRLARWYVRKGRAAEARRLTGDVIRTLDDEEVATYLEQFAGYGAAPSGDSLDWDNKIALQMTRQALARFPNNATIAKMLLDRLAADKSWADWERVAKTYYFTLPDIRTALLRRLSETGRLEAAWRDARGRASSGLVSAAFAADGARWLSRFDEAIDAYRTLVELYPGDPAYAEPLADLLRSFGSRDPKLYLESAAVLDGLAAVYPTDHRYPTRAGEALAEYGDMSGAAKRWRHIIAHAPGDPAGQLEVATLFWDYYQFEDAARTLEALRASVKDPTLYAYRLAAVYDSNRDMARALPEYVRALAVPGGDRDSAAARLSELARDPATFARIKAAHEAERASATGRWQLTLGFADFLRAIDATGEAVGVINREAGASEDAAFLEEARNRFRSWRSHESEARVLARLAETARDERARIRARLQLAALHDEQGDTAEAVAVFERLLSENPTNVGVIEEAARYYWRVGEVARSTALYQSTIAKAQGDYRKRFVLELARRQEDAGKFADAEATLRAHYTEGALDMEVFGQLARVLGAAGRQDALAALYRDALGRSRELGGEGEVAQARIAELRNGMVAALTRLGRFQEAVDQHIEIVNRDPENEEALDAAFDYASRHDLTQRLVGYYEKLAAESHRDFRWGLVLGRLYDRTGNAAGAAEAYARAVLNEPQRVDIRGSLADALVRAGRDEDAAAELRRAWEIDGRDPDWLTRVARIRARQGRLDEAARTIDEAVAARPGMRASKIFSLAKALGEWGLLEQSAAMYDRGVKAAIANPNGSDLYKVELGEWATAAARVRPIAQVYGELVRTRDAFRALQGRADDEQSASAAQLERLLGEVLEGDFARTVVDYADEAERAALSAEIARRAAATQDSSVQEELRNIARAAGLAQAEEAMLLQEANRNLVDCGGRTRAAFASAMRDLVAFYHRHAQFAKAAQIVASFRDKGAACTGFGFDRQIAESYRLAGDVQAEIAALERVYAAGGTGRADDDFADDQAVRRLFELLVATGRGDRLVEIAGRTSPYQLTLVNFLVERGDEALARRAVAATNFDPAWINARTGQLGLYFRNGAPEIETAFREALGVRPIGELVGIAPDATKRLLGADYFVTARNYGMWLDLVAGKRDDARGYIVGRIEDRPRDGAAQAQLARYYLVRDDVASAARHAVLAASLDPGDREVVAVRAAVLFAEGKRREALEAWGTLLGKDAGSEDYRLYFRELASRGLVREALEALRPVIARDTSEGDFGDVSGVIGDMADYGRAHEEAVPLVSDALYGAALAAPEDFRIAAAVLAFDLLPDDRRSQFFRLITDRLEGQASAQLADPDGASGYWRGEAWIDPVGLLNTWRKANVEFLVSRGAHAEALKLLDAIESEQVDARGGLNDGDATHDYSWVHLARATALLRAGKREASVAAATRYCAAGVEGDLPDRDRCVRAALVLREGGAEAEADAVLESTYRALLDARRLEDANFTGLAEVLYRRGRSEEADGVLRRLAARRPDSAESLVAVAEAAARGGRYALAVQTREAVSRLARADALNRLELARLRAASGDAARGASEAVEVALDGRAPNRVRAAAVDVAGELAADATARAAALARLGAPADATARALAARLAVAGGDLEGARAALGDAPRASAAAAVELGRLEMAAGRTREAIAAFEQALALDPAGTLSDAIAFAGATPAEALVTLYPQAGRPDAALHLAATRGDAYAKRDEDEDSGERLSFEPDGMAPAASRGLETLSARSAANLRSMRIAGLAALAEAAAKTGAWDEALAYARARVWLLRDTELVAARRRVDELLAMQAAAQQSALALPRLGAAPSDEGVWIRDMRLD